MDVNVITIRLQRSFPTYLELQEIPKKFQRAFKITSNSTLKTKFSCKAKEDINKFTDLQIDFIENKLAKKVVSIKFIIKKSFHY